MSEHRLIDANALIEDVYGDLTDSIEEGKVIEKIMNAPTIEERKTGAWNGRQNAELVAATIGTFADRIKALPSAEPKIIRCAECSRNYGSQHNPMCDFLEAHLWPDSFCSYAERRTDA